MIPGVSWESLNLPILLKHVPSLDELLKKWEEDREFREIRKKKADWDYIKKQEPRIKLALILYIETGDIYLAARTAGMTVSEFNEHRYKAKIPNIT